MNTLCVENINHSDISQKHFPARQKGFVTKEATMDVDSPFDTKVVIVQEGPV